MADRPTWGTAEPAVRSGGLRGRRPIVALVAACLVLLAGVADLAWGILFGLQIHRWDVPIAAAVLAIRQPGPFQFWAAFTENRDLAGAIVIILFCATALWLLKRRGPALIAFGVLLGLSRLYIGVHWWSEVLGGWMFALAWLAAWSAGWIWLRTRAQLKLDAQGPRAADG